MKTPGTRIIRNAKPTMKTDTEILDINRMQGAFVQIMSKNMLLDQATGRQANYSQQAFLRGCDGMFLYYSFDPEGPYSGFMPITEVMDVIRVDHVQNIMNEEDGDGPEDT